MDAITLSTIIKIVIAVCIILLLAFLIYRRTKNKTNAKKFLDDFINTLYKNIITLISSNTKLFKRHNLEESKVLILDTIYDSCWDYIYASSKSALASRELKSAVFTIIDREFVDSFVDELIEKFKINDIIEEKWADAQIEDNFTERVEEEDKKLQEKFSDPELYNEEIDETKDLELVNAGVAYTINEDGTTDEIERPDDVEDPDLDTEKDESVEVINDALTEDEVAAGIHFNRIGRKIDKLGRYVKNG